MLCIGCSTLAAIGGLRAIVAVGLITCFLSMAGSALPSGLALLPMGFQRMWDLAGLGGRLVLYEYVWK